jgi:hypothetical protein
MRKPLLFAVALASCKQVATPAAATKDFAYSATAKNYAIIAGFNPEDPDGVKTDVANWKNMLSRGQLGTFEVIYASDGASAAAVKAAFEKVGAEMSADSTVLFAFSGRSNVRDLRASDGPFTFADEIAAMAASARGAGKTGGHRLYVFTDASPEAAEKREGAGIDKNRYALAAGVQALEGDQPLFGEVFEFSAASTDLSKNKAQVSYNGRFTYEFIKTLDKYVGGKATETANPTLATFFDAVVAATASSEFGGARYSVHPDGLVRESMFSGAILQRHRDTQAQAQATATTTTVPAAPGSSDAPFALSLALSGKGGATDINKIFKGSKMLIEVSASWCGPCANLAGEIADDAAIQELGKSGKCSHATILPNDNNSNLDDWNSATNNAAADASFQFDGSSQELTDQFLSKLKGQSVAVEFFPTVFVIDRSGSVVSLGAESALEDFKNACK